MYAVNFSKSQRGKIQTLLELSSHSHLKKEGMTAAIAGHRRRGGCIAVSPTLKYSNLKEVEHGPGLDGL